MRVLVTGGAGFIGLHLSKALLDRGASVTILDNFLPQVHGHDGCLPQEIANHVELVRGDIADSASVRRALQYVDCVVHFAAETGTGQSMYEVSRYSKSNLHGTAVLLDAIANLHKAQIARVVVASSRAIYGEGAYHCERDGLVYPLSRSAEDKRAGIFDPTCPICGNGCIPAPTPESAPAQPSSFYGLTKFTQEQMVLLFGRSLGIPSIALRYQNVYGPGQSLRNPYTGILAVFSNLARTGGDIKVFEDGSESRDFVYVGDVIQATVCALANPLQGAHSLNVGSGSRISVLEVADRINQHFGNRSQIRVGPTFREGDIRHGFADLTLAREVLGYSPTCDFETGLKLFLNWAEESEPSQHGYDTSLQELRSRGLLSD